MQTFGAALTRAPREDVCARQASASVENIVDLIRAVSQFTKAAQIDDFVRLLYGRLTAGAGGQLHDDQTELLARMAQGHCQVVFSV